MEIFNNNGESLIVELPSYNSDSNKGMIIAAIYRPPDTDVIIFNTWISQFLKDKNRKEDMLFDC
jgi:hypothetical protein